MTLLPLINASTPIPQHALAAFIAVILGAFRITLKKGTKLHRVMGYIWVSLMVFIAFSSFFIHEIRTFGSFSLIHILSIYTLFSVIRVVRFARKGEVKRHRRETIFLYILGLILPGIFTFLPGRIMFKVISGS